MNVGFAQAQQVKLKGASNQSNANVLMTGARPRPSNGSDDSTVIKRIVMFPVRLAKKALSALGLRSENAHSKNSRAGSKANVGAISIAQAELDKVPSESQNQFSERLIRLIKYERDENWNELYSLLSFRVKDVAAKEGYVQNRISQQRQDSTYKLLQFDPTDIQVFDKSIFGIDTWVVHGCGKFKKHGAPVYLSTTSEAVLEKGLWFFSGFQIVSDLDAPPKECVPNETPKELGRQEQRSPTSFSPDPVIPETEPPRHRNAIEPGDTRRLLLGLDDIKNDRETLASLFRVGDYRIEDLIAALDDSDDSVSLRAQTVIRYLGNPKGMKALTEWYDKQSGEYVLAGPVPTPLSEWDYKFINMNFVGKPPATWRELGIHYLYALALDSSDQSKLTLHEMIKSAGEVGDSMFVGRAIRLIQIREDVSPIRGDKNVAELVLKNAFFISSEDHKYATAKLIGLNGNMDKALIEIHIKRALLAEEWYHVVIIKSGEGWRFLSVTQVVVS